MPRIKGIPGPYRFFFSSFDCSEPPHVHVDRENMTAKLWLSPVRIAFNLGFSRHELRRIERIVTGEEVEIRVKDGTLTRLATGERHRLKPLGEVAAILEAGDVFAYARQSGFLK